MCSGLVIDGAAVARLADVRGVQIRGCRARAGTGLFLNIEGPQSERVMLVGNDLAEAEKGYETGPGVPDTAVFEMMNLLD